MATKGTKTATANITTTVTDDGWGTFDYGGIQFLGYGMYKDKKDITKMVGNEHVISYEHLMQQCNTGMIDEWWSILDSQSTVNVFCNGK